MNEIFWFMIMKCDWVLSAEDQKLGGIFRLNFRKQISFDVEGSFNPG